MALTICPIGDNFSVCKMDSYDGVDLGKPFCFTGCTDEELSLVCLTRDVPEHTTIREDGWKGFRIEGVLDFSLIGILADVTGILAKEKISVFAISTYNTDYVLTREENFTRAIGVLENAGYKIGRTL